MAKYMFRTNYTQSGLKGLLAEGGSGREAALRQTIEGVGGSLEGFYYAFGECDLYLIADLPDEAAATALSLNIAAAGCRRGCAHGIGDRSAHPGDRGRSSKEVRPVPVARRLKHWGHVRSPSERRSPDRHRSPPGSETPVARRGANSRRQSRYGAAGNEDGVTPPTHPHAVSPSSG